MAVGAASLVLLVILPGLVVARRMDGGSGSTVRAAVVATETALTAAVARAPEPTKPAYLDNPDFSLVPSRDRARFPGLAAYVAVTRRNGEIQGRPVRFVEVDPRTVEILRATATARVASLFVTAEEARKERAQIVSTGLSRAGVVDARSTARRAPAERGPRPVRPPAAPR